MVATTDIAAHQTEAKLRQGSLNLPETIGQSIANISPTLTPALNIAVVAGIAGTASWVSYLIATIGCVFVGANISTLAKRHPEAGSYFVYIGRNLGPVAGAMAGWLMILAYLACAIAVVTAAPLYINTILAPFNLSLNNFSLGVYGAAFLGLVAFASFRDIKMSSRAGLLLEALSMAIIVVIIAMVVAQKGTVIDPKQLDFSHMPVGGMMSAMAFAVFSFVGFESSATLAKEARNPQRAVPFAVIGSAAAAGLFFVVTSYFMVMGSGDNTTAMGNSASPFSDMTKAAHLPWAGAVVYFAATISAFACALACLNAGSRMLFSMGRYQFLHSSMGLVHKTHQTPYVAVGFSTVIVMIGYLGLAITQGYLNAFNIGGTISTYGFVVVYLGVSIVSSLDVAKTGKLSAWNIICSLVGVALMGFVIYSSVIPWPAAPDQYLPQIFAAYIILGLIWFMVLKSKSPQVLASIANDMEG
nr:APC family permease [uncultured Acidocella sp.]